MNQELNNFKKRRKKDVAAELIRRNQEILRCPVCGKAVGLDDSDRLICSSGHSFDLARSGYLNLLTSPVHHGYGRELFEARRNVLNHGFFTPLLDRLSQLILEYSRKTEGSPIILDAGCGEGSHLIGIQQREGGTAPVYVGADIAKEAISLAAASQEVDILWMVADLTRLPIKDRSVDLILNILSPANYPEFSRVLSEDGHIIKVVPGEQYLSELRRAVLKDPYSNRRVTEHFSHRLNVIHTEPLRYTFSMPDDLVKDLIKMTPLTWDTAVAEQDNVSEVDLSTITVDLEILVGTKG